MTELAPALRRLLGAGTLRGCHRPPRRPGTLGLIALGPAALIACGDATGPGSDVITVNGIVMDELLRPQSGVGVMIAGHPYVITDADGRFTVTGVRTPYVLGTGLLQERGVLAYSGLTRGDPMVVVPGSPSDHGLRSGSALGRIRDEPGYAGSDHQRKSVYFESPEAVGMGSVDAAGTYVVAPRWRGPSTTTGTIHALRTHFDPTTGLPTEYGYGTIADVTLSDGEGLSGMDVQLAPIEAGSISGSVSVPDGYAVTSRTLSADFGTSPTVARAWHLFTEDSGAGAFDYVTPILSGATFSLSARAEAGQAYGTVVHTGLGTDARDLTFSAPAAPVLLAPEDEHALVGVGTQFGWTGMDDAVYLLAIRYAGGDDRVPTPPSYYVFTTETTAPLADLSGFGMPYQRGTPYTWTVHGWAPVGSVDDIAVERWFFPEGDMRTAGSAARSFTIP